MQSTTTRSILRAGGRAGRFQRRQWPQQRRFQSTESASQSSTSPALIGAVSGATAAIVVGYGLYRYSGAHKAVNAISTLESYKQDAQKKIKAQVSDKAPSPNEALKWLRQVAGYYAGFIPGASHYVESTFDVLEKVRSTHGEEADKIINDAYEELKGLSQQELNLDTAQKAWEVLQKHLHRIADLAGDAAGDILESHPQLKSAVGDNLKQLKSMGDSYGPQAKDQVEKTYKEIRDAVKDGFSPATADKVRKIVQEKIEQVKKLGDEAWQKGLEQAKPLLDKNPKVKELVEENADALKNGNVSELWNKVKEAVNSGSSEDLEKYVKQAKDKAQQSLGGWDQYLKFIPGSEDLQSKLKQLTEIAQAKGPEAKKLLEATAKDIEQVLSKRSEEAKKLAEEAKKQ